MNSNETPHIVAQTETLTLWSDGRLYRTDPSDNNRYISGRDYYSETGQ